MTTFIDVDFTHLNQVLACIPLRSQDSHRVVAEWSCDLLIFNIRLLWKCVSNAADKSIATQTVRSGGFLWLNPIAISVVNCSRTEVVEFSGLKLCWSGKGRIYLLMLGRIRVSMTFAAVQRCADVKYPGRCPCQASV